MVPEEQDSFTKFFMSKKPRFKYCENKFLLVSDDPNVRIIDSMNTSLAYDHIRRNICVEINGKYYSIDARYGGKYSEERSGNPTAFRNEPSPDDVLWDDVYLSSYYGPRGTERAVNLEFEREISGKDSEFILAALLEILSLQKKRPKSSGLTYCIKFSRRFAKRMGIDSINYEVVWNA